MAMANLFLHEWVFTFALIAAAGACGAGVIAPFAESLSFPAVAAPLAGMLLVPWGANAFYTLQSRSYESSALLSGAACLIVTAIQFRSIVRWRDWTWAAILWPVMAALAVLTLDTPTLRCHGPAILFVDGTDHGGYAQVADWLNGHTADQLPQSSPDRPYESWPALMFSYDTRFGTYGLMAIISRLHGTSGIFSYDIVCAVVLAAACLGVAAVYVRSPIMLILLALGLFTSYWFDYAYRGYLGKIVGYPGVLLLVGLALSALHSPSMGRMFFIAVLASAVGIAHAGQAASMLIAPILGLALAAAALPKTDRVAWRSAAMFGLAAMIPLVASGILARPEHAVGRDVFAWPELLTWLLELESQVTRMSGLSQSMVLALLAVSVALWLTVLILAVVWRSPRAVGLAGGPLILLLALAAVGAYWAADQIVGYVRPAILCGTCVLLADVKTTARRAVVVPIFVLLILFSLPRFRGAMDRYVLNGDQKYEFTESEVKPLVSSLGGQPVQIDVSVPDVAAGIVLMDELGRRGVPFQFSEQGWQSVVSYRHWPWPRATPPSHVIRVSAERVPGHQFDLILPR